MAQFGAFLWDDLRLEQFVKFGGIHFGFLEHLDLSHNHFLQGKTNLQALVIASDGSSVRKYLTNSVSDLLAAFF